jgi:hypothetical protein
MKLIIANQCIAYSTTKNGNTLNNKCFLIALLFAFASTSGGINAQQADTSKSSDDSYLKGFLPLNTKNPTIKLFGGMGNTSYDNPNYPGYYNSTNSLTLELGFTTRENYSPPFFSKKNKSSQPTTVTSNSPIEKFSFSGIIWNFQFSEHSTSEDELPFQPYPAYNQLNENHSFGFISLEGANYKAVNVALLNGGAIFWTQLDLVYFPEYVGYEPPEPFVVEPEPIKPHISDGGTRFADKYIAEINAFKIANTINLNVGVARSVIYERFLFGKWCGSMLMKGIANGLLSSFVGEIRTSSPLAYPVVNFLLRGALDFGFTELQRKKMNFPFASSAGYIYDEFRIGLSFEF